MIKQSVDESMIAIEQFHFYCSTDLDAFEIKGLTKILRVSWTAKKTNEWVINNAGV